MPTNPSPHKQAALAAARRSTSPLPPQPPPKAIESNSSTRSTDRDTGAKITRRAFLCDLVVERDGEETSNLLPYLGQPLEARSLLAGPSSQPVTPSRRSTLPPDDSPAPAWSKEKQAEMETRLKGLIEELVRTERSYLSRVEALKKAYADPLRNFARQEYSKIIPMYEAKTLFTNIDSIITASTVFSRDLEEMFASGQGAERVGTVCLRHLKDLKTFEPYRSYLSKQDGSQKMFHEVMKKYSSFGSFIERTKYQTTGIGNIGLRELLMEPVQRIPRYTLLWQTMVKCLPTLSDQRPQLMESVEIASRIARCEPDPQTVRATVMYCLERNVDGFPANLISNNRDYLDSIDVEDIPTESQAVSPDSRRQSNITSPSASTPSLASMGSGSSSAHLPMSPGAGPSAPSLHCTLFLFDDKLMIVKRQSSTVSGRKITGLDDMQALVRSGGGVAVLDKQSAKKDKLSFRGLVDVSDVVAVDVGNGDFQLFLENQPSDLGERWSGRPFRFFSTVQPPFGVGLDPVASRQDKLRFLGNLWSAQARARSKILPTDLDSRAPSQVLASKGETGLDNAGEPFSRARLYWNVWKRRDWIVAKKARVVVHIDEDGESADLPLSSELDPSLAIRLQPLAGGLCRLSYTTADEDETERLLVSIQDVVEHMVTTIHQFGAFKIRATSTSAPTTPGGTQRFRPSLLNLDTLSRNLFGNSMSARSHSTTSDHFGSNSTKRSKSGMSRSSTQSSNARRHSTSLGSALGHDSMRLERIPSAQSEAEDRPTAPYRHDPAMGQSEIDLNERLNLARKNSKSVAALSPGPSLRLGAKSVGELRHQQTKSADLRRRHSNVEQAIEAEAALRDAMRAGSPSPLSPTSGPQTPLSPTAPLRIRKTPSPSKGMTSDDTPKAKGIGIGLYDSTPTLDAMIAATAMSAPPTLDIPPRHLRSPASHEIMSTLTSGHLRSPASHEPIRSPPLDRMSSPPPRPTSAPIPSSPRPLGPRSPTLRGTPVYPGLGSGHTSLRVVSGNGRKITPGRATMPLRDDLPRGREVSGTSVKRQHSADQLSPRKRSPSRSPLDRSGDVPDKMPDPLPVPMLTPKKSSTRKTPTRTDSQRSSGPLTPMRRVSSAGSNSVTSQTTSKTEGKADHPHAPAAIDSTRHNIHEARAASKKLRSEIHTLRKLLRHDSATPIPSWVTDKNGSLPRSPHRKNIQRLADKSHAVDGENIPPEHNRHDLDEIAQSISTIAHRLEDVLKIAAADGDQASVLVGRLLHDNTQMFRDIEGLRAQVMRKKEAHDQLKTQLADVQVEVDVIYEAFNTELDGMFNDVSLPPAEAFEAMRLDLQDTKARRNELALENMKLKRELEEAKLKRDQWARMLKQQGVLP